MKTSKYLIIIIVTFLFINCTTENTTDTITNTKSIVQDSLAFELCKIYGSDQGIRDMKLLKNASGALKFSPHLDSVNFFKILDFVKKHGMPNEKLLGQKYTSHECVEAATIAVLLHTPHMLINNKEYLNVFVEEVKKGNMKIDILITVLDKYYLVRKDKYGNRRLLYGSQFGKPCIMYRKESDSVRAVLDLPPLPDSMFVNCNNKITP